MQARHDNTADVTSGLRYLPRPALTARFEEITGLAVGPDGSVYVCDGRLDRVYRVSPEGILPVHAGSGASGYRDGPAAIAQFSYPCGVAADAAGNVYVGDSGNDYIRKIDREGNVSTIAGTGRRGDADGPAAQAQFYGPGDLAIDAQGAIYVADLDNRGVRRIDADGTVSTGCRTADTLNRGCDFYDAVALDAGGNLYVASSERGTVVRVAADGEVVFIAGVESDDPAAAPDDPQHLNVPTGLAVAADGNLYIACRGRYPLRRLTPEGVLEVVIGPDTRDAEGLPPISGAGARRVAVDRAGNVYCVGTDSGPIWKLTPDGSISRFAGTGGERVPGTSYADGPAAVARFSWPQGIAVDDDHVVYIADSGNNCIRRITPDGMVETLAGTREAGFADGQGAAARFAHPWGLALDRQGELLVADFGNDAIRRVGRDGAVTTIVARAETTGAAGEADAAGYAPCGVAISSTGVICFSDDSSNCIRRIEPDGAVVLVAGSDSPTSDDEEYRDGPGLEARFETPHGIAFDAADNLYVADFFPDIIRKLRPDGFVGTLTPHADPRFFGPYAVAVGPDANLYVGDFMTGHIYRVTPEGEVSVFAGEGPHGCRDGPAAAARFSAVQGLAVARDGTVYVADTGNDRIRRITPDGDVTTLAGSGERNE